MAKINVDGFTGVRTINAVLCEWPIDADELKPSGFGLRVAATTFKKMFEWGLLETGPNGNYALSATGKRTRARRLAEVAAIMSKKP